MARGLALSLRLISVPRATVEVIILVLRFAPARPLAQFVYRPCTTVMQRHARDGITYPALLSPHELYSILFYAPAPHIVLPYCRGTGTVSRGTGPLAKMLCRRPPAYSACIDAGRLRRQGLAGAARPGMRCIMHVLCNIRIVATGCAGCGPSCIFPRSARLAGALPIRG